MNDKRQTLYDTLVKDGYDLGDFNSFSKNIDNPEKRKNLYDTITHDGYDVGDYDSFSNNLGLGKTDLSIAGGRGNASTITPAQYVDIEQGQLDTWNDYMRRQADKGYSGTVIKNGMGELKPAPKYSIVGTPSGDLVKRDYQTFGEKGANAGTMFEESASYEKQAYDEETDETARSSRVAEPKNQDDVVKTYLNAFSKTKQGGNARAGINDAEKEIVDKYQRLFLNSNKQEIDELRKEIKDDNQFRQQINNLFLAQYGKDIDTELEPYYNAYQAMAGNRYSQQIADDTKKVQRESVKSFLADLGGEVKNKTNKRYNQLSDEVMNTEHTGIKLIDKVLNAFSASKAYGKDGWIKSDDDYSNYATAEELVNDSQKIINAVEQHKGVWQGFKDSVFDPKTWEDGLNSDYKRNILKVLRKANDGEQLSDSERKLLDAQAANLVVNTYYGTDLSRGYKAGQTSGVSLPFMIDFVFNPLSKVGGPIAKGLLKWLAIKKVVQGGKAINQLRKASNFAFSNMGKATARILGDAVAAAGMTASSPGDVSARMYEELADNYIPTLDYETGDVTITPSEEQVPSTQALKKALTGQFIENQSEMAFNAFRGAGKVINDALPGQLKNILTKLAHGARLDTLAKEVKNNKALQDIMRVTQVRGMLEENAEEWLGNIENALVGNSEWGEGFSKDELLDTFFGLAPTQAFYGILAGGGIGLSHGHSIANSYKERRLQKQLGEILQERTGMDFSSVKEALDGASLNKIKDVAKSVLDDGNLTKETKKDALQYIASLYRDQANGNIENDPLSEEDIDVNKQIIWDNYIESRNKLNGMLTKEQFAQVENTDLDALDNMVSDGTISQEQEDAIVDFRSAQSDFNEYSGLVDERADAARKTVEQQINSLKNEDTGNLTRARIGDSEDNVYIKKGTLVSDDEGNIDLNNSDKIIYYRDESGKVKMAGAENFSVVIDDINANDVATQAGENAAREVEENEYRSVEPEPQVGTSFDIEGKKYVYTGKNENGEYMVQGIDENRIPISMTPWDIHDINKVLRSAQEQERLSQQTQDNSNEIADIEKTETEQTLPEEEDSTALAEPTALERVPKDEAGQPIYEQAEPETAWDAIVEQTGGDETMAQTVVDDMVTDMEAAVKKAEKTKPKSGSTISDKIAAEKNRTAAIEQAKETLAHWKKIAATNRMRQASIQAEEDRKAKEEAEERKRQEEEQRVEREEAERKKREALNGAPDIIEDNPGDARARGYRRVNGDKVDRQTPLNAVKGKEVRVKFDEKNIPSGHVALIDADKLQPSHKNGQRNPLHFIDEAQPKERKDDASVEAARKIASNIRPEEITSSVTAYTGAPTVNTRGEVIQGNNRSAALKEMWAAHKEQGEKYKQYLIDHAEELGLNPDDIAAMEKPVLVNMLDVNDDEAIALGQFVASDTESGGVERIKPKNVVKKLGEKMNNFANLILRSADEETSFSELIDRNGVDVLKWMNANDTITPTQYRSALNSDGSLTAEAKNDLKGMMYQSVFEGGSTQLEEMFNALPVKAQRAILATAYRDYDSPKNERMVKEIQKSIMAYYALSRDEQFMAATNHKDARLAVETWKRQYAIDDNTGESYLPAEKYSNFALLLATMYKGDNQRFIQGTFNKMYDLIQGVREETLFEKPDNTPRTLAQAIKETLNIDYNGQQGNSVLAGGTETSQRGEQGSDGDAASGGRSEDGVGDETTQGGTDGESGTKESVVEEPQPIGHGDFGAIYNQFKGKANEAVKFLLSKRNGEAIGALHHKDVGDIDLVWGEEGTSKSDGFGLAKLAKYHPEVLSNIQEILDDMVVTKRTENHVQLESEKYQAAIRLTWDNKKKTWLLTMFEKKNSALSNTTDTDKTHEGNGNDTATPESTVISANKDTEVSDTKQEKEDIFTLAQIEKGESVLDYADRVANEYTAHKERKAEEAKVDTNPTEAQKEAGNYRKGHIKVDGMDVTIEQPKGSIRRGKDANGKEWKQEMHNTYGYIRGTESVDGDHIDIFLPDNPSEGNVFVVDQVNKDGSFDEHKCMYGFPDVESAKKAYLSNYEDGWQGLGNITEVSKEDFKKWIGSSKRKTKPFAEYSSVKTADDVKVEHPIKEEQTEQEPDNVATVAKNAKVEDTQDELENSDEYLNALNKLEDIESRWNEKIKDYVFEHYPTQATVSAETNSEKGRKERARMKKDETLRKMVEQSKREVDQADNELTEIYRKYGERLQSTGKRMEAISDEQGNALVSLLDKTGLAKSVSVESHEDFVKGLEERQEADEDIQTSQRRDKREEINRVIDQALSIVMGEPVKEMRRKRIRGERKRKQEAKEIYEKVLSGKFDDVTLRQINDYINEVTPNNPFGRRLSQRLPQAVERRMFSVSSQNRQNAGENDFTAWDALCSRISENAVRPNERFGKAGRGAIEERKKEILKAWAIATGNWHTDISDFTDSKEPIASGTDSDVYPSKDGKHVIKFSKGKQRGKFLPDTDNVPLFNYLFPNTAYKIVGYGEINGNFVRILEQPAVDFSDAVPLSVDERVAYMRDKGFEPTNDDKTAFSNGEIVVADLQKSNILKDANGSVRVIDADVKLHTKDFGGDYTYLPVEEDFPKENGNRYQIVYHGSGADFKAFDHSHIGEGEGNQAHGWGTYIAVNPKTSRTYAEVLLQEKYKENRTINDLARQRIEQDGSKDDSLSYLRELLNEPWSDKKRVKKQIKIIETGKFLPEGKTHLYTVDIPDNNGDNYLEESKPLNEKQLDIVEGIIRERGTQQQLDDFKKFYRAQSNPAKGKAVYNLLRDIAGSDKAASELLHKAGFTGIHYIGVQDGDCYVIFDDKDLKIIHHERFMRTNNGTVYGYVDAEGNIHLDRSVMNGNTPVHEFGHLWNDWCKKNNAELWNHGVELIKQSPYYEAVKKESEEAGSAYYGMTDEQLVDEAMARAIGDKGEQIQKGHSLLKFAEFKAWLADLWNDLKKKFGIGLNENLEDMTLDEFTEIANRDLLGGEKLKDKEEHGYTHEELSIIDEAKANGTYMKAPNGQPTNLTEKQWVQVRTKAFKEWFGDWEKSARIEKLRKSKPIKITGKEIESSTDLKQYKKNALAYGKNLRGTYTNADSGKKVEVNAQSIKEVIQHDYKDIEHLQSVAAIPQIIEKGIYIETIPNEDKDSNSKIKEYQYYVCGLKIGDVDYTVKSVIAVDNNGNRYYDHKLTSIKKGKLLKELDRITNPSSQENSALTDSKDKRLFSILQTNSSKVVDENGEPLVIYHGTNNDKVTRKWNEKHHDYDTTHEPFTIFRRENEGIDNQGFFFNSDAGNAYGYGSNTYDVFLNLRNPLVIDGKGSMYNSIKYDGKEKDTYDWATYAEENGYDGVVFKLVRDGVDFGSMEKPTDEFVAFEPNQIKSATDNVGTFDEDNPDIRYQEGEKDDILYREGDKAESFEARRDAAVKNKGTVVPGLNEAKVNVVNLGNEVDVPFDTMLSTQELKDVAVKFAKENDIIGTMTNNQTNGKGNIMISANSIKKMVDDSATSKSENKKAHLALLPKLRDVIRDSILAESHPDYKKDSEGKRKQDNGYNPEVLIHRAYGAAKIGEKVYRVKITLKENPSNESQRAYSYEVTKIELLAGQPSSPIANSRNSNNSISTAKLLNGIEKSYDKGKKLLDESGKEDVLRRSAFGGEEALENEHKQMAEHAKKIAETLHLDNVEIITDTNGLTEKEAKSKGFYSVSSGKITIVVPNHESIEDIEKTVLHEGVAHYGLRRLVGEENMDEFLDNIYKMADKAIRERIAIDAIENYNGNIRVATEEYLAGLAELDMKPSVWDKVKEAFKKLMQAMGLNVTLNDNELSYILWRSKQNLNRNNPIDLARDIVKQYETNTYFRTDTPAEEKTRYPLEKDMREAWDNVAASNLSLLKETMVDYLGSVEDFYKVVGGVEDINDIKDYENAYFALLALSSKNRVDMDNFDFHVAKPLNKAIAELTKKGAATKGMLRNWDWSKGSLRDLVVYVESKHGLERNRQMTIESVANDLKKEAEKKAAEGKMEESEDLRRRAESVLTDWQEEKERINNDMSLTFREKQLKLEEAAAKSGADLGKDYSGLSSIFGNWQSEAIDNVEEYENTHDGEMLNTLWGAIKLATEYSLEKQLRTGLVNQEYVDRQRKRFDYYIPLRGFADETAEEIYPYLEHSNGKIGSPVKSARGRISEAGNPFGAILEIANASITTGNKNQAKQKFFNFVVNHKSNAAKINNTWIIRYDELVRHPELRQVQFYFGEEVPEWVEAEPNIPEGASSDEVADILNGFENVMNSLQEEGKTKILTEKTRIKYRTLYGEKNEHEIPVMIGGKKYTITIAGNPRVANAINGKLNPSVNEEGVTRFMQRVQGVMASAFTGKNPAFSLANLSRDTIFANNQAFIKENPEYWWKFTKNQELAFFRFKDTLIWLKKYQEGTLDLSDSEQKLFKKFMDNGGATGYTFMNNQKEFADKISKDLNELAKRNNLGQKVKDIIPNLFNFFEYVGQASELVNRYAAYKTGREMGRSVSRSITDAKEISVNFNRKGAGIKTIKGSNKDNIAWWIKMCAGISQFGRDFLLFWNANIQSKYLLLKNIKKHPTKAIISLAFNSMFFSSVMMPVINNIIIPAILGYGDGDDDEDYFDALTDYKRQHNICIRLPKGGWLTIPVSLDHVPFYAMGDVIGGKLFGKREITANDFIDNAMDAVLPFNINHEYKGFQKLLNMSPTVTQPVLQVMMNTNFMGAPLRKEGFGYTKLDPEYKKVYKNTNSSLVQLSKWVNDMTGGDDVESGLIDFNPANFQNLLNGYLGGFSQVGLSLADFIIGDESVSMKTSKMPIVSRFYNSGAKDMIQQRLDMSYRKVSDFNDEMAHKINRYKKIITDPITDETTRERYREKIKELLESDDYARYQLLNGYDKTVTALRKIKKVAPDNEKVDIYLPEIQRMCIEILRTPKKDLEKIYDKYAKRIKEELGNENNPE